MTMSNAYNQNDIVYLRESASRGVIEPVRIGSIMQTNGGWQYTIRFGPSLPINNQTYGDKKSLINNAVLYFNESELLTKCQAYELAEAYALALYNKLSAERQLHCPTT